MDPTTFDSLMAKLQLASWTPQNVTSDVIKFRTLINLQVIELYDVNNGPLYINDLRPELTGDQIGVVRSFISDLATLHSTEISNIISSKEQQLDDSIQSIIS